MSDEGMSDEGMSDEGTSDEGMSENGTSGGGIDVLLRDAADGELGDVALEHPVIQPTARPAPRRARRGVAVLAAAAVAVVVVGGVFWGTSGDGSVDVQAPASGPVATDAPAAAENPPPPAVENPPTTLELEPPTAVAEAIEATLATSWEATRVDSVDPEGVVRLFRFRYDSSGLRYDGHEGLASYAYLLPRDVTSDSVVLGACDDGTVLPCTEGQWLFVLDDLAELPEWSAELTREMVGLLSVEPTGPALSPGVYPVRFDGTDCGDQGCLGTLRIDDGMVVELEVATAGRSFTWTYGSFGETPESLVPSGDADE
ncbi:MAG: hypothetical protein ACK5O2_10830 [Microthrixaceae bacterium]